MKPPCKKDGVDCPKRELGCRAACSEWKAFREKIDAANAERRKVKAIDLYVADSRSRLKYCEAPIPSVTLKNRKKKRERSAAYNAKVKKVIKSGGTGTG